MRQTFSATIPLNDPMEFSSAKVQGKTHMPTMAGVIRLARGHSPSSRTLATKLHVRQPRDPVATEKIA